MEKNIISIIHFQKPSILSWNTKCPFLPPLCRHQANKAQPQKNPPQKEPGVSGDIFEYANITKVLSTLISCHSEVQSSLCITLRQESDFLQRTGRRLAGGWRGCGCGDASANHHILAFVLIAF